MANDWMGWVGFISNVLSFLMLSYSTYHKILDDCKYDPHELTEIQKMDEMYNQINDIHEAWVSPRTTIHT